VSETASLAVMDDTSTVDTVDTTDTTDETVAAATAAGTDETAQPLLDDELLVEEISIDGMCGVY